MARGRVYRRRKVDGSLSGFHAVIDLPREAGGRRQQATRTFNTRTEANAWLAAMSIQPSPVADRGPLTGEFLQDWLEQRVYLRPSTRASYRMHLERHIIPSLGSTALAAVDQPQIERFVHALSTGGLAPGSVERILATLRSALGHAVRIGVISSNPTAGVRAPQSRHRIIRTWTPDETSRFMSHLSDDGLGILLRLAVVTGMRRGELLALRWIAINPDAGIVRIDASRVAVGSTVVEGAPKSRSGSRVVFLDTGTIEHLRRWKAVQQAADPITYVCTDTANRPFVPWHVSSAFRQIVGELGLPLIRLHDLRHTSATLGLAAGESLKEVSVRLGHADIAITATVYAAVQPATARASVERRVALMNPQLIKHEIDGGAA